MSTNGYFAAKYKRAGVCYEFVACEWQNIGLSEKQLNYLLQTNVENNAQYSTTTHNPRLVKLHFDPHHTQINTASANVHFDLRHASTTTTKSKHSLSL